MKIIVANITGPRENIESNIPEIIPINVPIIIESFIVVALFNKAGIIILINNTNSGIPPNISFRIIIVDAMIIELVNILIQAEVSIFIIFFNF